MRCGSSRAFFLPGFFVYKLQVETLLGCSKFPAINILNELVAEKIAVKSGSGPAVKYRLA